MVPIGEPAGMSAGDCEVITGPATMTAAGKDAPPFSAIATGPASVPSLGATLTV